MPLFTHVSHMPAVSELTTWCLCVVLKNVSWLSLPRNLQIEDRQVYCCHTASHLDVFHYLSCAWATFFHHGNEEQVDKSLWCCSPLQLVGLKLTGVVVMWGVGDIMGHGVGEGQLGQELLWPDNGWSSDDLQRTQQTQVRTMVWAWTGFGRSRWRTRCVTCRGTLRLISSA